MMVFPLAGWQWLFDFGPHRNRLFCHSCGRACKAAHLLDPSRVRTDESMFEMQSVWLWYHKSITTISLRIDLIFHLGKKISTILTIELITTLKNMQILYILDVFWTHLQTQLIYILVLNWNVNRKEWSFFFVPQLKFFINNYHLVIRREKSREILSADL